MGKLTNKQNGKLGAHVQYGTPISQKELNEMANQLLKGTPESCGVLTDHQIKNRMRKERPRGSNPAPQGRVVRKVG